MQINQLAALTSVSPKTIRYYESIGVLPQPRRNANGYRDYEGADVKRLKLVAGARRLEFSLDDVTEIIAMRDRREAPVLGRHGVSFSASPSANGWWHDVPPCASSR